jgi:hypothetical protein
MRDGSPFGIAGVWENWKDPPGEWRRTFAILTVPPNELIAQIYDRMPAILRTEDYDRWLGDDADPNDMAKPFPADGCTCGPSRRASISPRMTTPRYSTRFPRRPPEVYREAVKRSLVSSGLTCAWLLLSAVSLARDTGNRDSCRIVRLRVNRYRRNHSLFLNSASIARDYYRTYKCGSFAPLQSAYR